MIDYTGLVLNEKYRLDQKLGEGGMGAVYLGEHLLIGRKVAVKILLSSLAQNEEAVKRFFREARASATIGHQNIVDVLDVGVSEQGDPYLVMEYLEGEGLEHLIDRTGPMSLEMAIAIVEPMLMALKAAHKQGIVHRDIKPENIFLAYRRDDLPQIKIIDFGISKVSDMDALGTQLTQAGTMLGTPAYMSPEQARGLAHLDHRTDIYAVGVFLYHLLTDGLPYTGTNYNELLSKMLTESYTPPSQIYSKFPEEALPIIERCLQKEPEDRYQNADEMLSAITGLVGPDGRHRGLFTLAQEMSHGEMIAGDLGAPTLGADSIDASEVLSQFVEGQPKQRPKSLLLAPWLAIPKQHRPIAAVVALLLLAGLIALVMASPSEPKEVPEVKILVDSMPKKTSIYYDDSLVSENPFRVDQSDKIVQLRVEAWGYNPVKVSIVPNENQKVSVRLWPSKSKRPPKVTIEKDVPLIVPSTAKDSDPKTVELAPPPSKPAEEVKPIQKPAPKAAKPAVKPKKKTPPRKKKSTSKKKRTTRKNK